MDDLIKAKEDALEASYNINRLANRISYDEGKRLDMLVSVLGKYIALLEEKLGEYNNA